jgi:hypothetical protein
MSHKKSSNKSNRRSNGRASKGDDFTAVLVPYNERVYTDKLTLPKAVEQHYSCIKTYQTDAFITQNNSAPVTSYFAVNATVASDFASLANVFDQYRISMVEVTFRPQATESLISATQPVGNFVAVIDYDDQTPLSSFAQACAYSNAIVVPVTKPLRRCFRPRVAIAGYGGATFTQYTNQAFPWTDTTSTSLIGYGLKLFLETGVTGALASYNMTVRVYFEFRSTR